jgi:hypothetical protein
MNRKSLVILSLIAAVVLAIWLLSVSSQDTTTSLTPKQTLLTNLTSERGTLDKIIIQPGGSSPITLVKNEQQWVYQEKFNFPANLKTIRKLLDDLSDLSLLEAKTSRPDNYPLIGVEEPTAESGQGVKISFFQNDTLLAGLIVGHYQPRIGTFVREVNHDQSWQVKNRILVDTRPVDWLHADLLPFKPEQVKSIEFRLSGSPHYQLSRQNTESPFEITTESPDIPAALTEQRAAVLISELPEVFKAEDVAPYVDLPQTVSVTQTRFETFDGKTYVILSWKEKDHYFAAYPFSEEFSDTFRPTWKISIAEPHFNRLNRTLSEISNPE